MVGPDQKPACGVQVDVRDEQGNYIGAYPVDNEQGEITIHVPRVGNYSVSLATFDSGALKPAAKQVFVNHPAEITLELTGNSWSYNQGGGGSLRETTVDIPYPLLGAGFAVPSAPATGPATTKVNELGVEGGPRVPRVDSLFEQLLGTAPVFDPERTGGQLGILAQQFGLQRRRINTIDEEQNLTNFIILVEYVLSLKTSWDTQRGFFTRTGKTEPFFGTQLVLVSRALSVVAESVQEVYAAMDSVFVGPAERQVVELTFPAEPGQPASSPSSPRSTAWRRWRDRRSSRTRTRPSSRPATRPPASSALSRSSRTTWTRPPRRRDRSGSTEPRLEGRATTCDRGRLEDGHPR